MDYSEDFFRATGTPCNEIRIKEIENKLHRKLPDEYKKLIMQTGGGQLSEKRQYHYGDYLPEARGPVEMYAILGNGGEWDLCDESEYITEVWGQPKEVLVFATSFVAPHECFAINYSLTEFPQLSIIYLDSELGDYRAKASDSFEQFMSELAPLPSKK